MGESSEPVPVETVAVEPHAELVKEFTEIEADVQSLAVGIMAISKRLKKFEKMMHTQLKQKAKKTKGVKKNETPMPIDVRLMKFMGLTEALTTRSEALRKISEYVRKSGLQVADDKRTFTTDNTLASLFGIPKGEKLTFLAINKHITPLFKSKGEQVKKVSAAPVEKPVAKKTKSTKSSAKVAEK